MKHNRSVAARWSRRRRSGPAPPLLQHDQPSCSRLGKASLCELSEGAREVVSRPRQHELTTPQDQHNYWMRAVSFTALLHTLHVVAEFPEGLTTRQIDDALLVRNALRTRRNQPPSRTTLYHYRNTLLRLGALVRVGSRLRPNRDQAAVCELLRHRVDGKRLDEPTADQLRTSHDQLFSSARSQIRTIVAGVLNRDPDQVILPQDWRGP